MAQAERDGNDPRAERWPWWHWPRIVLYRWWVLTPYEKRHVDPAWWKCYR